MSTIKDTYKPMRYVLPVIIVFLFGVKQIQGQVAVIAHKSVPTNQLERSKLLDFYTGDIRQWGNGKSVVVFDMKPKTDVKKHFYKYLGKTPSRMKSIWLKNMLSGETDPPEIVQTENEMLKKIAKTPGAIGYINAAKVTSEVKIVMLIASFPPQSTKK